MSAHRLARSPSWRDLARPRLSRGAVRRARLESVALIPLVAGVLAFYRARNDLLGPAWDTPVRVVTAVALVALGWQFARGIGRSFAPNLYSRVDTATAGTIDFVIRLLTLAITAVVALRIAGLGLRTLALSGAVTAVVGGLAAQQTLGNLIAGTVLVSARTFRVGERVRLIGGPLAGAVEGVVASLGVIYTTLLRGADRVMVPNSVVLTVAVVPLREPDGIDLRVRLARGVTLRRLQRELQSSLRTPSRGVPDISLEEVDRDGVVVRIVAVPRRAADGPQLAAEVLEAVARLSPSAPA
ncbi:MAG: MscS Mechanosensitive ion channel [Solirubrobacterales bacterium]|nr:MscS Mechanosensitive ion channel [Solirubrobacterales bacterium]